MDTRSQTTTSGTLRSQWIVGAAFSLFVILWSGLQLGFAQPPAIRPAGSPQVLQLIDTAQPGVFPEQSWKITAPKPLGATVAIWSVEPFHNLNDSAHQIDAQLNLRILSPGRNNTWQVIVPAARTQFAAKQNQAQVVAASQGGNADAGITVTFLCQEQPLAADGNYQTTVIGTITEAF